MRKSQKRQTSKTGNRNAAAKAQRHAVNKVARAVARPNECAYQVTAKVGRFRRSVMVVTHSPRAALRQAKSYFAAMYPDKEIAIDGIEH